MEKSIKHMKLSNKILITTGIVISLLIFITMVKIKQIQADFRENQTIGNKTWITHEVAINDFDQLELGHHFKANWHRGEAKVSIKIEENLKSYLRIQQDGLKLRIDFDSLVSYESSGPIIVDIYSMGLKEIRLTEFVDFTCLDTITGDRIKLEIQDHSQAEIILAIDTLDLMMYDFSRLDIGGSVSEATIRLNDHTNLEADKLIINQVNVDMNDFTKAYLVVNHRLKAQCMDHSNLEYRGDSLTSEIQQRGFSQVSKDQ